MEITSKTRYADFAAIEPYITQETADAIRAAACQQYKPYAALTIDEFWGLLSGDFSLLGDMQDRSVLQEYWVRGFADFVEQLTGTLKRMQLPEDPNKTQALQKGCVDMTPQEGMLVFVRNYFGLPSFLAAGRRTLGEFVTAKKDDYNKGMQRHNFEAMQAAKLKIKK